METMFSEAIESGVDYLDRLIPGLEAIVEQPDMYNLRELFDIAEGITFIVSLMLHTQDLHGLFMDPGRLKLRLQLLEGALESKDSQIIIETIRENFMGELYSWLKALRSTI